MHCAARSVKMLKLWLNDCGNDENFYTFVLPISSTAGARLICNAAERARIRTDGSCMDRGNPFRAWKGTGSRRADANHGEKVRSGPIYGIPPPLQRRPGGNERIVADRILKADNNTDKIAGDKSESMNADVNAGTDENWYAMKVFFDRTADAADAISAAVAETYIPMHKVMLSRGGSHRQVMKPVVTSLLFFKSSVAQAREAERILTDKAMLYSRRDANGRRHPAAIPQREMDIFRLVVSSGAEGLEYLPDDPERFVKGTRVRVTAGPLTGAEGYVVRIRGDRRLVVSVRGVCAVATAYIPQCFLEPINQDQ